MIYDIKKARYNIHIFFKFQNRFVLFNFDEDFVITSDFFGQIISNDGHRKFGFLDSNRKAVFGDADHKRIRIQMNENQMYSLTITRTNSDGETTVMARFKYLDNWCLDINNLFVVGPNHIENTSIDVPPFLETPSTHFDIQLEVASMSIVEMAFENDDDRYANLYFDSSELVFVMPGNNGHERQINRSIVVHEMLTLPAIERTIATRYIHNFIEQSIMDGTWTDIETILPALFTYLGIQRYLPQP